MLASWDHPTRLEPSQPTDPKGQRWHTEHDEFASRVGSVEAERTGEASTYRKPVVIGLRGEVAHVLEPLGEGFAQWMVHGRASWSASLFQFILLRARTWGSDLVERASTGVTREQQRPRGTLAALEIVG
jgi:hypothetical protein